MFYKFKFPVIFIRSANVYGEGQQLTELSKSNYYIKKNKKLFEDSGEIYRSFIHIEDNSKLILRIINKGKLGLTHPSTNKLISLKTLSKLFKT